MKCAIAPIADGHCCNFAWSQKKIRPVAHPEKFSLHFFKFVVCTQSVLILSILVLLFGVVLS